VHADVRGLRPAAEYFYRFRAPGWGAFPGRPHPHRAGAGRGRAAAAVWARNDRTAGPAASFDFDNWDGYRVQRRRLLHFFGSGRVRNPVVLTGDRHATWVCDLKPDFDDTTSPVIGAELTGTSLASGGNGDPAAFHRTFDPIMADSPHWKFIDNRRGYLLCHADRDRLLASLRVVDTVTAPTARISTLASFVVSAGRPGVDLAYRPG